MTRRFKDELRQSVDKKIITWGLLLAVMPVFCSVFLGSVASALAPLNLVKDVVAPITNALTPEPTVSSGLPQSQSVAAPSGGEQNENLHPSAGTSSQRAVALPDAATAPPLDRTPLATLSPIMITGIQQPSGRLLSTHVSRLARPATPIISLLQPSDEGWMLLGVAWYWWASLLAALIYGVYRLVQTISQIGGKKLLVS